MNELVWLYKATLANEFEKVQLPVLPNQVGVYGSVYSRQFEQHGPVLPNQVGAYRILSDK